MHPIELFTKWINKEKELSEVGIPTAVCLSTNGIDGFPNARIVSLKDIVENNFVITGSLNSRKGIEMENNNKVALTFWWTETERQVRVQGTVFKLSNELSDRYFNSRDISSQAVSSVCEQGKEIDDLRIIEDQITNILLTKKPVLRPSEWRGLLIKPFRIEFMEFKKTRFHKRKLYEFDKGIWKMKQIQP